MPRSLEGHKMTDMDMPLPEPVNAWRPKEGGIAYSQWSGPVNTADQIRARDAQWRAIVAAEVAKEREECAKLCDGQAHVIEAAAALADADDRPAMLSTAWKIKLCAAAIRAGSPGTAPPSEPV